MGASHNRDKVEEELKSKAERMKARALLNGELVKQLMDSLKASGWRV